MTLPDCMMPDGADPCEGYTKLHAEVKWLRAELNTRSDTAFREWSFLNAKITEAAAFLDGLAERCDISPTSITQIAFDCRAMVKKLRGIT